MKSSLRKISICLMVAIITLSMFNVDASAASYSKNELRYLSAIVYAESGNQSHKGKVAVANVVLNRVKSRKYPNSIKSVIYQKGQFTPARNGSLKKALSLYDKNSSRIKSSKAAAKKALSGSSVLTKKYLYFSGYSSKKTIKQRYGKVIFIGAHYFR
ncbi:hypothetical protein lbkm_3964 [Lachnospiraceae bacterium KM106-2]|nr:hypothetical protein lbkm_3964 [Lachnospiraceae bacterium KM106-2]